MRNPNVEVTIDGREVDVKRAVPEEEMAFAPSKVLGGELGKEARARPRGGLFSFAKHASLCSENTSRVSGVLLRLVLVALSARGLHIARCVSHWPKLRSNARRSTRTA